MRTIVVAVNSNFLMGTADGKLPWHIPAELKNFKETTMGCPVIMGHNTWQSLPQRYRPLPGRNNIVVSRTHVKELQQEQLASQSEFCVVNSIEAAMELCEGCYPDKEVFIIGGRQIYEYFINNSLADRILASVILGHDDARGTVYFPPVHNLGWIGKTRQEHDEFSVVEYRRRKDWANSDPGNFYWPDTHLGQRKALDVTDSEQIS